jgi:hypothetical protein
MDELPLHRISPWLMYPVVLAIVLLAQWAADTLGRHAKRRASERTGTRVAFEMVTTRGALIGLLSLMIGFTFSLTLTNFVARRQAVVNIATTISVVRDRIRVLPPPQAMGARQTLEAFIDAQIGMGASTKQQVDTAAARSVALREALLEAAVDAPPSAAGEGAFEESVVLLGQRLRERLAAEENQAPPAIFLMLYALTLLSWSFISYATAAEGQNNRVVNGMMAAVFIAVVALVADVDRPYAGLVRADQTPLLMLKATAPIL